MFDIIGLRKEIDPKTAAGGELPASKPKAPMSQLWAVLLLLDTVFLCVFGGALAGMIWLHRPAIDTSSTIRPKVQKALPKNAPAALPQAPAAKTETPEPAAKESEKPAPKTPAASKKHLSKGPIGSPGMTAPDLPRREASPASSHAKPEAKEPHALAPDSAHGETKVKAKPVEFACRAPKAKKVQLRGAFLVRTQGVKTMVRDSDGVWRLTVTLLPGTYKYRCIVDGKKIKPYAITVP